MLRHLEVSEATLHRWRNQYGRMKAEGARHLRELERENGRLRLRLRQIAREHTRWGYRRATVQLRCEGLEVNRKRVQRLWRQEGLRVPRKARKRRRGTSTDTEGARRRAQRPGEIWAIDFQFDATNDGRQLKSLNIIDEHTRQALATEVSRSCDADGLTRASIASRPNMAPQHFLRMDNVWAPAEYWAICAV